MATAIAPPLKSAMPPLARLISLSILTVLIVALAITFYQVLAPFLLPLFLAWVTAILCRPLYLWCVRKTNGRERLAAGLTTAGLLLIVLLPLVLGTVFASVQLIQVATNTIGNKEWRQKVVSILEDEWVQRIATSPWIEPYLATIDSPPEKTTTSDLAYVPSADEDPFAPSEDPFTPETSEIEEVEAPIPAVVDEAEAERRRIEEEERLRRERDEKAKRLRLRIEASLKESLITVGGRTIGIVGAVPGVALGVLGQIVSLLVALVMFAIGLYYFLCDGPALIAAAESLIPVQVDYQRELLHRFDQVVRAVVLSTFLSALAQGLLTAAALGFAGFGHLLVFFVLASLAAMIPLAGTWLVWGPCVIWLVIQGQSAASAEYAGHMSDAYRHWATAGLLSVFGIVVVGTIDNVIRTYILNSSAKLHPLLAFVSVLGGLQVMGLWGVFIAPVVAACLHALMQIFNAELKVFSLERTVGRQDPAEETGAAPTEASPVVLATATPAVAAPSVGRVMAKPVPPDARRSKRRKR